MGRNSGHIDGLTVRDSVVHSLAKCSDGYIDVVHSGTIRNIRVRNVPMSEVKMEKRGCALMLRNSGETLTICQRNDDSDVRVAANKTYSANDCVSRGKMLPFYNL